MSHDEQDQGRSDPTQPIPPPPGAPQRYAPGQGGYAPPPGQSTYGPGGYGPPPGQQAYGQGGYGPPPAQSGYSPQPYAGQPYGYGAPMVPRKEPALSLIISFFIPGVGTMINGEVGKGVAILIGFVVSWFLIIILIGFLGILGFWIWGMVDAYQGAVEFNRRHGYPG